MKTSGETNTDKQTMTAKIALASAVMSGFLGVVLIMVKFSSISSPPLVLDLLVWSIPATALLEVLLGILTRKTRHNKTAIIIGGIIAAIWLIIAVPNLIPR